MTLKDSLLPEFDHEMATTRRILERVPERDFEWRPHDRSMSLGELAGHIAHLPSWCSATLETTRLDVDTVAATFARLAQPESLIALLRDFTSRAAAARVLLVSRTDAELLVPWTLTRGDQELFTMPRFSAIRSFVLNHLIHHRGQLTVYLRLKNVPVPPIYGPTADES